jgi:sialidase-1
LVIILSLLALPTPAAQAASAVEKVDVFVEREGGYHTYRIPALIKAANGSLLAFCEGRKSGGGDSGDIDILLRRSSNGGRTWSPAQVVWDDGTNTCGNPCPVLDESTGTLWLLLTHNIGTDHEKEIAARTAKGTRTVWIASSKDHGITWTSPVEITSATKDPSWTWYATGPGIGIQIKQGAHAGRLVIPCDHNYDDPNDAKRHLTGSHAIYSDDHGATWKLGAPIRPTVNECQVAELFDGRGTLLMNMRANTGRNARAQATSTDGGETWTAPADAEALIEPVCQASLIRHEPAGPGTAGLLLFSNPAAKKRVQLTVRASADNAKTWQEVVVLNPGPSAYSSLVSLDARTAGCLYENGEKRIYERLTFARIDLSGVK